MGDLAHDSRRRPDTQATQRALPSGSSRPATAGKRVSCSNKPLQQQQQSHYLCDGQSYHDNNNNTSGKVRLLISPATDERGSARQQQLMAHSAATINSPQQQLQQQRSQPLTQSRQKNYHHHHYDYYTTDSDLTSSIPATQSNHYEENILLFATEHNNEREAGSRRELAAEQQVSQKPANNGSGQRQQQRSPQRNRPDTPTHYGATGKFVNYYPSWRQNQSPATSHHQNYSFHVPLNLLQQQQLQQLSNQRQHHQSGYGFVAPAERVSKGGFKQSFRSSTIAHIPNLLKVSAPEGQSERLLVKSENDLLKVHLVPLNSHQEGYDNPFKPGTELSWEADMMVRLMKRGYPLQELPVLVQTAKQVAQVKRREQLGGKAASASGVAAKLTGAGGSAHLEQKRQLAALESRGRPELARRQSSNDLSSGKQVWADTLSRTKSLPRFVARGDNDSIDRLISSIEREMGELQERAPDQVSGSPKSSASQASSPTKKLANGRAGKKATQASEQQVERDRHLQSSASQRSQAAPGGNDRGLTRKREPKPCCRVQ